jgi:hypothetical protein
MPDEKVQDLACLHKVYEDRPQTPCRKYGGHLLPAYAGALSTPLMEFESLQ